MNFSLTIIIVALLALPSCAWGQAKVGTTGGSILELSPAIRANGMGEAGVALVDPQGWFFNPGILGISSALNGIVLTPYAGAGMPADIDHYTIGGQVLLRPFLMPYCSRYCVSLGYQSVSLNTKPIEEIDYFGVPTGRFFSYEAQGNVLSCSFGLRNGYEIGFGVSAKYLRQSGGRQTLDHWAFDAGFIARLPLTIYFSPKGSSDSRFFWTPTIGLSVTNLGNSISYIRQEYPLPRSTRFGFSSPVSYHRCFPNFCWEILGVTPAIEIESPRFGENKSKTGIEVGLSEAAYFRFGKVSDNLDIDKSTWGFTADLRGFAKLFALLQGTEDLSSVAEFFIQRVHLQYLESHSEWGSSDAETVYRGVLLGIIPL